MTSIQITCLESVSIEPTDAPADKRSNMKPSTWSALFKERSSTCRINLLDLPAEIIDIILGYVCSNWAVSIRQLLSMSPRRRGPLAITPHPQFTDSWALAELANTNSLLHEHLKRCLHAPESFSGYTQLVNIDFRTFMQMRGPEVLLDPWIGDFWPSGTTPEQVLWYAFSNTTVLEMSWEMWEGQHRPVELPRFFPKMELFVLVCGLQATRSPNTVKEVREAMVDKVKELEWSDDSWGRRTRQLVAAGVRVTFRTCMVHPSTWGGWGLSKADPNFWSRDYHPMILSMDVKGMPGDPSDLHVRPGPRDFHSPCCPTGRLHDWTLRYPYAELAYSGLQFKPATSQSTQICDVCRHWRLIWSGVNGDRKRFNDKGKKTSMRNTIW